MPTDGRTLVECAIGALEAHQALLRAIEKEPARQRDIDDNAVAVRWARWFDEVMSPAWVARDAAITPLLAHSRWLEWHRSVWRDDHTATFRAPYVWRPVAVAIVREAPR